MDIYEYCENNNEDCILLFADFEEAFDSVEWNFLFSTLIKFDFGSPFISWIKIYTQIHIFMLRTMDGSQKMFYVKRN
jgi:hypothetical protein